uniref:(northern house mosquito) hypothetical protein n=1 Tax=Culex pipiens TaxID=7175 RepID=A0A8D8ML01_CULPI
MRTNKSTPMRLPSDGGASHRCGPVPASSAPLRPPIGAPRRWPRPKATSTPSPSTTTTARPRAATIRTRTLLGRRPSSLHRLRRRLAAVRRGSLPGALRSRSYWRILQGCTRFRSF